MAPRCIITNEQQIADCSSRAKLLENADGAIDLSFGPNAPVDQEFFGKSWVLPIIGRAK